MNRAAKMLTGALAACGIFAASASAADVILIQGYDPSVITDGSMPKYGQPTFDSYWGAKSATYWQAWTQQLLGSHNVLVIKWSSKDRMPAIVGGVVDQIEAAMSRGFCASSCAIVSHSTGGPVTTNLLRASRDSAGTSDDYSVIWKRVPYAVHMAPAWNGAVLAEIAVNIGKGSCSNSVLAAAAGIFLKGLSCGMGTDSLGVSNDLVRSNMVNNNGVDRSATPNFPVSGEGSDYFLVTSPIIGGNDDGVLSADSTCGSRGIASYDSCSKSQDYDGEQTSMSAPTSLYNDVYPLIMTGESHGRMMSLASPNDSETLINNTTYGRGGVSEETTSTGYWFWAKTYKNLRGDNSKSSGHFVKDIFF